MHLVVGVWQMLARLVETKLAFQDTYVLISSIHVSNNTDMTLIKHRKGFVGTYKLKEQ